jgi:hypothetical protein
MDEVDVEAPEGHSAAPRACASRGDSRFYIGSRERFIGKH